MVVARKKVVEAPKSQAVNEWEHLNWADLQLGRPEAPPWPFTILFVGVNDERPDLCLRKEHDKIQAVLQSESLDFYLFGGYQEYLLFFELLIFSKFFYLY